MPRLLILIAAICTFAFQGKAMDISEVKHFSYWLSGPQPATISASEFDLVVVDHFRDGTLSGQFSPNEVAMMQRKPDGERRILLSYMSIGEAEDYRGYWHAEWNDAPPAWLDEENPHWEGNFKVRFWHPGWQALIFGSPEAYLDRIIAAGFDGVYLDIVDAYWYSQEKGRKSAAADMIGFVTALAVYAREKKPGFLIVPQNAEDLLAFPEYRNVIDAQGKEGLYYGHQGPDTRNSDDVIAWPIKHLKMALEAGKPVLLIEYPEQRQTVERIYSDGRKAGLIPYATVRDLDRMTVNNGLDLALPGLLIRN